MQYIEKPTNPLQKTLDRLPILGDILKQPLGVIGFVIVLIFVISVIFAPIIAPLELACQAQVAAMSCGTELITPPPNVIALTNHLYQRTTRRPWGVLEWPGLLRMLDRRDPSYRD